MKDHLKQIKQSFRFSTTVAISWTSTNKITRSCIGWAGCPRIGDRVRPRVADIEALYRGNCLCSKIIKLNKLFLKFLPLLYLNWKNILLRGESHCSKSKKSIVFFGLNVRSWNIQRLEPVRYQELTFFQQFSLCKSWNAFFSVSHFSKLPDS